MGITTDTLEILQHATDVVSNGVSLGERIAGNVGRGGPRWHHWRSLRLRLRAARVEARGRTAKARALRTEAAIHLAYAMRAEAAGRPQVVGGAEHGPTDAANLLALLAGREPLDTLT